MRLRPLVILLLIALLTSACDRPSSNADTPAGDHDRPLRIVSLSPAISRTLVDFGLGDRIVGRTQWCDSVDDSVPVVGDLLHADYERIVRLGPTHVLIQPRASGADSRLMALARQHGWTMGQWTLNTRDDIETLVGELPELLYKQGDPAREQAAARAGDLLAQIHRALRPAGPSAWRGRVLLIDSVDPVVVFGRETYLHDIVTALGAENASTVKGWKEVSLEDLTRLNPEAIIVVAPGADARQGESQAVEVLGRLDVDAVREDRIGMLTNPDALLPCSAIISVAKEVRDILESFE